MIVTTADRGDGTTWVSDVGGAVPVTVVAAGAVASVTVVVAGSTPAPAETVVVAVDAGVVRETVAVTGDPGTAVVTVAGSGGGGSFDPSASETVTGDWTFRGALNGPGLLLGAARAPLSGSGLLPLDGVNDPWRWFEPVGWLGPAYNVTWRAGDTLGTLPTTLPAQVEEYAIWVGSVTSPTEANNNPGQFSGAGGPASNQYFAWTNGPPPNPEVNGNGPLVADADGSGIAFLSLIERGFTGPTAVPDPTFTDIATYLGDVTLGAPYTFNENGDGVDGDFWLDTATTDLYGPKAGGVWPSPVNIRGLNTAAFHTFTNAQTFGPADFPTAPTLLLAADVEPDPNNMNDGVVALWYESTVGAPVVHFKGKDAAGTVFTAALPLT